jgi:hypothetical protein
VVPVFICFYLFLFRQKNVSMKIILMLVSVIFCGSESFRMFNRNTIICTHLKSWSTGNPRKTTAAPTDDGGSKNGFSYSNPSQSQLSGDSALAKVFSSNSVCNENSFLPSELHSSRSFSRALATASSRTVSKEERSKILLTMCGLVNGMNVIGLCQTVCR